MNEVWQNFLNQFKNFKTKKEPLMRNHKNSSSFRQ